MDPSFQYSQIMCNFDSAYNVPPKLTPPTMYIPITSSPVNFSTYSNRRSSPLFRRSISPSPSSSRRILLPGSVPKFNFDLYKMDDSIDGHMSPTYRSISPTSSRIIHRYPIDSPSLSPRSGSPTLSKLRQINEELCRTLARSDFIETPSSTAPHYHIHHYPLSQHSNRNHHSRSPHEERSPPTRLKSPKIPKARVRYKIHLPQQERKSSRHQSTPDTSVSDDPIVVDLYPTRDENFIKSTRKHHDPYSPWIVNGTSLRRSSYSDASTPRSSRTPRGPCYGDKPIRSHRRSTQSKEQPSSRTRESWHLSSKTVTDRRPKYFHPPLEFVHDISTGNHTPDGTESEPISSRKPSATRVKIRTDDPKLRKRLANAESKVKTAWQPTGNESTQSPMRESKPPIPRSKTETKVKTTWEPTATGLTQSNNRESKPVSPNHEKKTTLTTPPQSKVKPIPSEPSAPVKHVITAPPQPSTSTNTGRSSLNNVPRKPLFESTPRKQNNDDENDKSLAELFDNDSPVSGPSNKRELPRRESISTPPLQPRKPSTEPPKTTVPEPDKGTKSTVTNGILIQGNDAKNTRNDNQKPSSTPHDDQRESNARRKQPTPPPPPKVPTARKPSPPPPPPKATNKDNQSSVDDEDDRDENDDEVARSFDINRWLNDASKAILGPPKTDNITTPSTPPRPPVKSPPRRRIQPPSPESPDHNLYKPPFGPKKNTQQPVVPPPPAATTTTTTTTTTGGTDEVDDFFS